MLVKMVQKGSSFVADLSSTVPGFFYSLNPIIQIMKVLFVVPGDLFGGFHYHGAGVYF